MIAFLSIQRVYDCCATNPFLNKTSLLNKLLRKSNYNVSKLCPFTVLRQHFAWRTGALVQYWSECRNFTKVWMIARHMSMNTFQALRRFLNHGGCPAIIQDPMERYWNQPNMFDRMISSLTIPLPEDEQYKQMYGSPIFHEPGIQDVIETFYPNEPSRADRLV